MPAPGEKSETAKLMEMVQKHPETLYTPSPFGLLAEVLLIQLTVACKGCERKSDSDREKERERERERERGLLTINK